MLNNIDIFIKILYYLRKVLSSYSACFTAFIHVALFPADFLIDVFDG